MKGKGAMGTKNNPGKYDCYAKADPDEPMFVLLGRDPTAGVVVMFWTMLQRLLKISPEKLDEALACASQMQQWSVHKLGMVKEGELIGTGLATLLNDQGAMLFMATTLRVITIAAAKEATKAEDAVQR